MTGAAPWKVHLEPGGWRLQGPLPRAAELNGFLERAALRGLASGSLRTYAYDLLALLRWAGERALQDTAGEELFEFVSCCRGRIHPVTINRRLRLLQRLIRFFRPETAPRAVHSSRRRRSQSLPLVRCPVAMKPPLSHEEVRKLWLHLRSLRDQAIVALMWTSGLRIGEVIGLQEADVDVETGSLRVHGKGGKQRLVPMAGWVGRLVRHYGLEERPPSTATHLFLVLKGRNRGQPMTHAGTRRLFRYWRHILNLPQAHPHRFRHTFAANMIRHGVSIPQLMRLLGHAWPATTLRYVCFDDRQLRQDYERALQDIQGAGSGL
jgi:site-specific recombinase XerD